MKCNICDKTMNPDEIQYIQEIKTFDCCSVCLDIAMDAAYSGDFKRNEENIEELDDDIEPEFKFDGEVETLDMDTYQSTLEGGDAYDIPWEGDDYD